jgi:hypothetical protein
VAAGHLEEHGEMHVGIDMIELMKEAFRTKIGAKGEIQRFMEVVKNVTGC